MGQSGSGAIPDPPGGSIPPPPSAAPVAQPSSGWIPAPPPSATGPYGPAVTNGLAEASLVLGILGLTLAPLVASIVGLVLGYVAKGQIDRSSGQQTGRGLAVAGIVLGWIGIGFSIAVMALFFWLFSQDSFRG
jgi:hypothetical protein